MTLTWRQNWGVTALYVTPTQESGGSFAPPPRTPRIAAFGTSRLSQKDSSLFRGHENLMIGPSLFSFWALCDFAVKHSMRVVSFSLFSSIKFIVKDSLLTNIAVCWGECIVARGSVVVVVRKDQNVVVTKGQSKTWRDSQYRRDGYRTGRRDSQYRG